MCAAPSPEGSALSVIGQSVRTIKAPNANALMRSKKVRSDWSRSECKSFPGSSASA